MTKAESDENERYNREVIAKCDHEPERRIPGRGLWHCAKCGARVFWLERPVNLKPLPFPDDDDE